MAAVEAELIAADIAIDPRPLVQDDGAGEPCRHADDGPRQNFGIRAELGPGPAPVEAVIGAGTAVRPPEQAEAASPDAAARPSGHGCHGGSRRHHLPGLDRAARQGELRPDPAAAAVAASRRPDGVQPLADRPPEPGRRAGGNGAEGVGTVRRHLVEGPRRVGCIQLVQLRQRRPERAGGAGLRRIQPLRHSGPGGASRDRCIGRLVADRRHLDLVGPIVKLGFQEQAGQRTGQRRELARHSARCRQHGIGRVLLVGPRGGVDRQRAAFQHRRPADLQQVGIAGGVDIDRHRAARGVDEVSGDRQRRDRPRRTARRNGAVVGQRPGRDRGGALQAGPAGDGDGRGACQRPRQPNRSGVDPRDLETGELVAVGISPAIGDGEDQRIGPGPAPDGARDAAALNREQVVARPPCPGPPGCSPPPSRCRNWRPCRHRRRSG